MDREGYVTAGGRRLEYRFLPGDGTPGRPVLVFLHQGLGSMAMWRDTPRRIAERTGCPALVYSRHGYGESDPVTAPRHPDFMIVEGRDVLPEVLEALHLSDVLLVGHSDGATVALAYLSAGHAARAAIVAAPHVFDEEVTWRAIEAQASTWGHDGLRERLARYHRDPDAMFRSWADVWLLPGMRGWTMLPGLANIRCPLLAVQGVNDGHGTLAQIDAIANASGGPVELRKLPGCEHDPFRERPHETLALCAEFIARHAVPRVASREVRA